MTWASGDTLDSLTLNLRGASASSSVGFSSNTLAAESGNTVSHGTWALSASTFSGVFIGPVTGLVTGTLSSNTQQAQSGNTISCGTYVESAQTFSGIISTNTVATFSGATVNFSASSISVTNVELGVGSAVNPSYGFVSELSLGLYRSATSTLALSYGTLNLRGAALSLRTTTSSASASNLTQGEICLVAVSTTSAQLAFKSGNTVYVFNAIQASP